MRLMLHQLQTKDKQAQKIRAEHSESLEDIDGMLHHQSLL